MEDLSRYYTLLRNPARRKIIEILGVQEKIGVTIAIEVAVAAVKLRKKTVNIVNVQ